ncbi:MFS transporter [Oricola sp.]|uniref:MFS transporter n=1 Tax=Oricola sp. TaxID=1979950 RepID=UPI0025EE0FAB|nr:MFS transporter [Oricola sp.]MCI5074113.1 MFS transporter [Oricola sp.]
MTADPAPPASGLRARFAALLAPGTPRLLAAAMLALFLAALEQTIIGPVLGGILTDLGQGALVPWITTGFLLASTVAAPLYGAVADIHGRRKALLIGCGLFLAGSLGCALATGLEVLVLARIVQGAGAGGLVALPFIIVADRVPMRRRAVFSAYISTIYAVAGLLGPVAGSVVAAWLDWRWVFWINLPACALVIWGVTSALAPRAPHKGRRLDGVGALFLLCAAVPSILLLEGHFGKAGTLVLVVAAVSFWGLFARHIRSAADPLVPLAVMSDRSILLTALALAMAQGSNLGLAVYLPIWLQAVYGLDPGTAGVALLAFVGAIMVGAYIPPRLLRRNPAYKPMMLMSAFLSFAFSLVFCLFGIWSVPLFAALLAVVGLGLGIGLLYPIFTLVVQNSAGPGQIGAAIGVQSFLRSLGGTLGVTLAGAAALWSGLLSTTDGTEVAPGILAMVPTVLMGICVLLIAFLPARRLEGYAAKG